MDHSAIPELGDLEEEDNNMYSLWEVHQANCTCTEPAQISHPNWMSEGFATRAQPEVRVFFWK